MAKLKPEAICDADLTEYLATCSDFAFELRVLNSLLQRGVNCDHGGSYEDPISKKTRQFDIRATHIRDQFCVALAVECKNLHDNYPLLVCCVPRREAESFHSVLPPSGYLSPVLVTKEIRLKSDDSIYRSGDIVGKSCAQVGRNQNGDTLFADDREVYEKWAQAVSSAHDLATRQANSPTASWFWAVFPVLVVPNGTLWTVLFDSTGAIQSNPKQTDRSPFFLDKYIRPTRAFGNSYTISHLEIVTLDGLGRLVDGLAKGFALGSEYSLWPVFPDRLLAMGR